jgi:hypothetical protein
MFSRSFPPAHLFLNNCIVKFLWGNKVCKSFQWSSLFFGREAILCGTVAFRSPQSLQDPSSLLWQSWKLFLVEVVPLVSNILGVLENWIIVSFCQFSCVLRLTRCNCFLDWMFVSKCWNVLCVGSGATSLRWRYTMTGRMMWSLCYVDSTLRIWKKCLWDIRTFPKPPFTNLVAFKRICLACSRVWFREHKHLNTWHSQVWVQRVLMRLLGSLRRDEVGYYEWPFWTMGKNKLWSSKLMVDVMYEDTWICLNVRYEVGVSKCSYINCNN